MTSFINDDGDILILKDQITLTRQVATFFNFKIKGDFSLTFSVTNDSQNRKALQIFSLNQVAPDVKQIWNVYVGGNKIMRGELVVQGITPEEIELFFLGGNSNWINGLIENTTQLDLLRYVSPWTGVNAMVTTINESNGIVYPLVDWAYAFNKTTTSFRIDVPMVDSSENTFVDFYPCFYLKDLVKEILQQSGYKLAGNILQDTLYNKIIITPDTAEIKRNQEFINERSVFANKLSPQTLTNVDQFYKVTFDDIIESSRLFANSRYTGDRSYLAKFKLNIKTSVNQTYTAVLAVDGNISYLVGTSEFTGREAEMTFDAIYEVRSLRYYEVYVKVNSGGASANIEASTTLEIKPDEDVKVRQSSVVEYVYPNDFIKMKCSDVIKFVVMYFGAYVYFDTYNKTLTITKISKLLNDTAVDWSEYLQTYSAEYDENSATNNHFRFAPPTEKSLINYNKHYNVGFGEGNFITDLDINTDNELYTAPFQASDARITVKYGQIMMPHVGLIELEDVDEYSTYESVTDVGGIAQFNGVGFNLTGSEVIRVIDDNSVYSGYMAVSSTDYYYFQCDGMIFKGDSGGIMFKQKANFSKGKNRILLNNPNYSLGNISTGEDPSPIVYIHVLTLVTEVAAGSPVFTASFVNSAKISNASTTGTQTSTRKLLFVDDVTAYVTRTGNAVDQVIINWFRNDVLEYGPITSPAGYPVSEQYTFATTLNTDDFKVTITEG